MTLNYSTPVINPRLGPSFAIFASAYTCLVAMLIVLEQLGLPVPSIDMLIVVMPALFYIAIGVMTRTASSGDFLLAGQRVPPFYNALAFTASVFGGSIVLGSIGSLFFLGIDAIAIPAGCFAGVVLMGVLFVPYLRKAGANTLPGFFHLRFGHRGLRLTAAILMLVPCLIILVAEAALGGKLIGFFLPLPDALGLDLPPSAFFLMLVFASVLLTALFGGMRSATWAGCAQFVVFLGLLAPLIAVSVMRTNLPLPQLTYGSQLEEIKTLQQAKGVVTISQPQALGAVLPKTGAQPLIRPAERAFSAFRPTDFLLLLFCLATGVAAHPAFLPRLSMTPVILASRRSMGWATVMAGFIVLTLPAYAFFTEAMSLEALIGVPASDLPAWARGLQQIGLIVLPASSFDSFSAASQRVSFHRDTLALILPAAGNLPRVFFGLTAASALAVLSACAASHLTAIASTVSDDVYHGFLNRPVPPRRSLRAARLTMLLAAVTAFAIAGSVDADPLRFVIAAFSLSSGTFFSVLVLSVWWRRLTASGALAGLLTGFAVTAFYLRLGGAPLFGVGALTAGALGVPASFAAALIVSLVSKGPGAAALEAIDEMRVPAGETLQARMLRLAARAKPVGKA